MALALTAAKRIIPADAALRYVHTPEHTHIRMHTHTHTHNAHTNSTKRETGKRGKKEGGRETCRPAHTDIHIETQGIYTHRRKYAHARRRQDWTPRGIPAPPGRRPQPMPMLLLAGKTCLILGFGEVGRRVAASMRALGMKVL